LVLPFYEQFVEVRRQQFEQHQQARSPLTAQPSPWQISTAVGGYRSPCATFSRRAAWNVED